MGLIILDEMRCSFHCSLGVDNHGQYVLPLLLQRPLLQRLLLQRLLPQLQGLRPAARQTHLCHIFQAVRLVKWLRLSAASLVMLLLLKVKSIRYS